MRGSLYALAVAALLVLATILGGLLALRLLGYGTLVVDGGSMSGSIDNGALVITRSVPAREVHVGDVIVVRTDDVAAPALIHRVVSLGRDDGRIVATTKGDANDTPDPRLYIMPDKVQMPARELPYLGYFVGFVRMPIGWALFIALPVLAVSVAAIYAIWRPRSSSEREPFFQ